MQPTINIWLVTGMPGAGKMTVATALAARFDRGVHLPGDVVHDMIVSGHVEPDSAPSDEAERQIALTQRNLCMLARSFADAGFVPVLDWVLRRRSDLDAFLSGLHGHSVHLVVLAPGPEAVSRRKSQAFRRWAHLEPQLRRELGGMGLCVDNSRLTVEETVETVLAGKAEALQ